LNQQKESSNLGKKSDSNSSYILNTGSYYYYQSVLETEIIYLSRINIVSNAVRSLIYQDTREEQSKE